MISLFLLEKIVFVVETESDFIRVEMEFFWNCLEMESYTLKWEPVY